MENINPIDRKTFHQTLRTFLLTTAILFNLTSCKPDYHSSTNISLDNTKIQPNIIPDNTEIQPNTEQETPKWDYYCVIINDISKLIKEGDDWKKYIDDIYHYPIIEKDWKQYLIYNNTEYKLENCQRINDNNQEFYIYSLKNGWDLYYLADDEIHKWEIISDMWKTTDWKIYFTITDLETQKETFVFNWKEVGKLDHISKVYWDRAEKLLFVFWNDYNEEWNITYKLITNNNEHKIDYPYELIDGNFFDENVSLKFYKECFTLMNQ